MKKSEFICLTFLLFYELSTGFAQSPREYTADGLKPEFTPKTVEAMKKMANLKPISKVKAIGEDKVSLIIYPDPYRRSISLDFQENIQSLSLFIYNNQGNINIDISGKTREVQDALNRQMRHLAPGEYTLKIITKDKIYRRRLIVQQTKDNTSVISSQ